MKKIIHQSLVFIFALSTEIFTGCDSDVDPENCIIEPNEWRTELTITESRKRDIGTNLYNEVYLYDGFTNLENATSSQENGTYSSSVSYSIDRNTNYATQMSTITYLDNQSNKWEYSTSPDLNNQASHATYTDGFQERTYDFTYANDFLTSITEYIDGSLFSRVSFDYINDLQGTMTIEMHNQKEVANITYTGKNRWTTFPNYFLIEQYPLNMHRLAFYNGLLGVNYHVIASLQYEGSDEVTTFTYNDDMPETVLVPEYCQQIITAPTYSESRKVEYTVVALEE